MLNQVRVIREMCDDMTRDVMYYTSNVYKAQKNSEKYSLVMSLYRKYTRALNLQNICPPKKVCHTRRRR